MPKCAWCYEVKPAAAFEQDATGMLRAICMECSLQPFDYCGFCGLPVHAGRFYKISNWLHECMDCHEQTQAIIRKNALLKLKTKLRLLTIQKKVCQNI